MHQITLFNTYTQSANLGDAIIMDYAHKQLRSVFPDSYFFHASTHEYNRRASYKFIRHTEDQIVCGTNLLHNQMYLRNQWKINWIDAQFLNATFMGVGASAYYSKLDFYSKKLYHAVLSKQRIQSVRDDFTLELMQKSGFKNTINTGCPTTWNLNPDFVKEISTTKAKNVVTTITDYDGYSKIDEAFLDMLSRNYETVYFWPQGFKDFQLLQKLKASHKVTLLHPSLEDFDRVLAEGDIEYIGTRLHAGIRALNHKRRALIFAVDNRAIEMGKSVHLPVVERKLAVEYLQEYMSGEHPSKITIPQNEIEQWKAQFNR